MARFGLLTVLLACFIASGCRPARPAPPVPPPPTVTVANPATAEVQNYYEYNGHLYPKEMVEIRARVKGFLTDVLFKDGDEVEENTPLYKIEQAEYLSAVARATSDIARAEADMAAAKAQTDLSEAELNRLRNGGPSVTKSEVDKAVAALAAAKAQQAVSEANKKSAESALRTARLQLSYTEINAPIKGRISNTKITKGNLVGQAEATLLTTIVSVDPLHIYFDVPEKDWIEYQQYLKDRPMSEQKKDVVKLYIGVATEEGFPHEGYIDFSENRADRSTGTVRLRGVVDNPKIGVGQARLLYADLFARVKVPNGDKKDKLVIPEEALMTGQEGRFVYVIDAENKVQKRTVKLGTQVWRAPPPEEKAPRWTIVNLAPVKDGDKAPRELPMRAIVAIESGLEKGDFVIINGLQKARPGAPVNPEKWSIRAPKVPQ